MPNQIVSPVFHPEAASIAFLPGLALALAIGLLIGVERGWRMRTEEAGRRVAGVRTFGLLGLLGGIIGLARGGDLQLFALLVGAGAIFALLLGYYMDMRNDANISATSAVAAVLTLLLAAFATSGHMALASVGAGAMVMLLASRETLHGALDRTSGAEITALIRLALVVFLILPLLPDMEVGPYGGINPRRLWFVVVVVGAISFCGYILTRWLGGRYGSFLTALLGATVSSTAVTIEAARRMREKDGQLAEEGAVAIASVVMQLRVIVLVALLAPPALEDVFGLLLPAIVVSLALAGGQIWLAYGAKGESAQTAKPPSLALALLFAGLVAVISIAARWAEHRYGSGSSAAVIAIGGMVDVDSAIAAIGALPSDAISARLAALAIAAPVAFNTLLKLGLLVGIAGARRSLRPAGGLALTAALVAGTAAAALF